tara:strand:+ start:425 stop:583 length:159 start_codon:yes stop_codon:yes gene_type:complete
MTLERLRKEIQSNWVGLTGDELEKFALEYLDSDIDIYTLLVAVQDAIKEKNL